MRLPPVRSLPLTSQALDYGIKQLTAVGLLCSFSAAYKHFLVAFRSITAFGVGWQEHADIQE